MRLPLLLPLLLACRPGSKDGGDTALEGPVSCPREASGEVPGGDVNGDGAVDIADVVGLLRAVGHAGPEPVCPGGVDLVPDGFTELDDAFSLLVYLYEGGFSVPAEGCEAEPWAAPECAGVEAGLDVVGSPLEPFQARVTLRAEVPVEGWSLSVSAEGCAITAATTLGTAGASVVDDPPGLRDLGYDATFLVDEGAVSAVVLDFLSPVALPTSEAAPVLAVTVDAGGSCACTLRVGPALTAIGEPVESLVAAGGAAWPVDAELLVETCAK